MQQIEKVALNITACNDIDRIAEVQLHVVRNCYEKNQCFIIVIQMLYNCNLNIQIGNMFHSFKLPSTVCMSRIIIRCVTTHIMLCKCNLKTIWNTIIFENKCTMNMEASTILHLKQEVDKWSKFMCKFYNTMPI